MRKSTVLGNSWLFQIQHSWLSSVDETEENCKDRSQSHTNRRKKVYGGECSISGKAGLLLWGQERKWLLKTYPSCKRWYQVKGLGCWEICCRCEGWVKGAASLCNQTLECGLGHGILWWLRFAGNSHLQRIRVRRGADTRCRGWAWGGDDGDAKGTSGLETCTDLQGLLQQRDIPLTSWKHCIFNFFFRLCAPKEAATFLTPNTAPYTTQQYSLSREDQQLPA